MRNRKQELLKRSVTECVLISIQEDKRVEYNKKKAEQKKFIKENPMYGKLQAGYRRHLMKKQKKEKETTE